MSVSPSLARSSLGTAIVACLAIPSSAQESLQVFDAAQVQVGPLAPAFEALFDLDGDPYPDAIAALFGTASGVVGTYRNDGTGRFVPVWSASISGWFGGNAILPGDFDGDGRRDDFALLVSNRAQVWYCDGVGAPTVIGPTTTCPVGTMRDYEVADVDNDGRDDLVVMSVDASASPVVSAITLMLSTTRGNAPVLRTLTLGHYGARIRTAARRDGSHVTMLFTANVAQAVPIVIDASAATLVPLAPLVVASGLNDPAAGDLDGDGDGDIVRFGVPSSTGQYQILRQDPTGAFQVEPTLSGGPATDLADVDGDGDLDGVCCGGGGGGPPLPNHRASNFEIAINDGGAFRPAFRIAGLGARHIAGAADVDGDGDVDLVAGRVVWFARQRLTGSPFRTVGASWLGGEGDLSGPRDGDGDGDVDISVSPFGGHLNRGVGDFAQTAFTSPIAERWVAGLSLGDVDADGDVDAYVRVTSFGGPPVQPGIWSLLQTAPGRFALGTLAMQYANDRLSPDWAFRSFVEDFDGDGIPDLIVTTDFPVGTSTSLDRTSVYRAAANGTLAFVGNLDFTVKATADFDGDARTDLLVARNGAYFAVCRNLGAMAFASPSVLLAGSVQSFHDRVSVGDIDGDGDLDCALPDRPAGGAGTVVVFENDGAGNLAAKPRGATFPDFGGTGQRIARLADVDGDRRLDLLVYPGRETTFSTTVLLGDGSGGFATHTTEVVNPEFVADMDGDGAGDVVLPYAKYVVASRATATTRRGAFEQRGRSGLGSGGIAMTFGASGPFRIGDTIELRVRGALGGAAGGLLLGIAGTELRDVLGLGHDLYVDVTAPTIGVPILLGGSVGVPGDGIAAIPVPIPPSMLGIELHHQVGVLDPSTPLGVATSNGLRIRYGS